VPDWGGKTSLLYTAKGITSKVLGLSFVPPPPPKEGEREDTDERVVSYGVRHMLFWKKEGRSIISKKGIFGKIGGQATILCSALLSVVRPTVEERKLLFTGTNEGDILLWDVRTRKCTKKIDAHAGPVYALVTTPSGMLVSGGKDGKVKLCRPMPRAAP
jgi:WD40 repeat protein